MLKSHLEILEQFLVDKGRGEKSRYLQAEVMEKARRQCAELLKVSNEEITFLSSATEGINVLAYGLDWRSGDNVVVGDVEFPSDILPWTKLKKYGVEIRVVKNKNWVLDEMDILAQVDEKTKVVAVSQVSMFTGQHMDVSKLSKEIRETGALFLLDVTHAAGVVPVNANYADIAVSSCYKWLLGTHGTAIFYVNRNRLPDFQPPFIGWASVAASSGWKNPLDFALHTGADRFLSANPSYISIYLLHNALNMLLPLGEDAIYQHALSLSKKVRTGISDLGLELMTPTEDHRRSGNVCFMIEEVEALRNTLEDKGILVWGAYGKFGRVRVSTHVYNDSKDVDQFLLQLKTCL